MAAPKSPQITLDPRYQDMLDIEKKELKKRYNKAVPGKELALNRLIEQAARCKVLLDLEYEDISQHGTTELFSQSPNTPPYSRERPVAHLYISHEKNYIALLKALDGVVQQKAKKAEVDPLAEFFR